MIQGACFRRRSVGLLPRLAPAVLLLAGSVFLSPRGAPAAPGPVAAEPDPACEIRKAVDEVFAILGDPRYERPEDHPARNEAVRHVVDRYFDWEEMARASLGVHWRGLTPEQRSRFVATFKEILANSYVDDLERFTGNERVEVKPGEKLPGGYWVVKTILITHSRERVPIDYFMRRQDSRWMVYDFSVEGISQVNHYRRSFSRFLVNHSFEELMQHLERQLPGSQER